MRLLLLLSFVIVAQFARAQNNTIRFDVPKDISVGQTFELGIHFSLASISGMARLQLDFPKGFEVQEGKNSGALFTYSSNLLQLLWVQLPQTDSVHCAVKVQCLPGYGGKAEIPARFYFLENGVRKEMAFNSCKLTIAGEASKRFQPMKREESKPAAPSTPKSAGQTSGTSNKAQEKQSGPEKTPAATENKPVIKKEQAAEPKPNSTVQQKVEKAETRSTAAGEKAEANTPKEKPADKPDKGSRQANTAITFRIQLAAASERSSTETLAVRFNLKASEITEEFHNGMYKYTTGNFKELSAARAMMSKNAAMKTGCFIAGYENGNRIALEDAINLSKK